MLSTALLFACSMVRPADSLYLTMPSPRRLHYESSYRGSVLPVGPPFVSVYQHEISIQQAVLELAPQSAVSCRDDDVDLPLLPPGIYGVRVMHVFPNGDGGRGALITGMGGFILADDGSVQCTTTRSFALPWPSVPDSPVAVRSTVMIAGRYAQTSLRREGSTFHVDDVVNTDFPTVYVPYCLTTAVDLGKLPAGAYTVQWGLETFLINVAAPSRHRAAAK